MKPKRPSRTTVAIAVLLAMSACSSSSDEPVTDADDNGTDPTGLFGPAQYIVSECGSLAVSAVVPDNSLTAPSPLTVGEPVRGQIEPDSVDNDFHTWQVSLEPGNYHLIADVSVLKEGQDSIGLKIQTLGAPSAENQDLAADFHSGLDLRIYKFLEIRTAQIMTLQVDAGYNSIHNYTMGIFSNGTAVPSPTIERCLPVNALSLDTTESVDLESDDSREDDRWFRIDLTEQEYLLDASTTSTETTSIGYEFELFEQFGQTSETQTITAEFLSGTALTSSDTFEPETAGTSWIRLRNGYDGLRTVVFTISAP